MSIVKAFLVLKELDKIGIQKISNDASVIEPSFPIQEGSIDSNTLAANVSISTAVLKLVDLIGSMNTEDISVIYLNKDSDNTYTVKNWTALEVNGIDDVVIVGNNLNLGDAIVMLLNQLMG